jgi:hypothetical protein
LVIGISIDKSKIKLDKVATPAKRKHPDSPTNGATSPKKAAKPAAVTEPKKAAAAKVATPANAKRKKPVLDRSLWCKVHLKHCMYKSPHNHSSSECDMVLV